MPKPANLAANGGCWFGSASASLKIHLGVDADFRPAAKAHPAMIVDDLAEMVETLEQAGHAVSDGAPLEGFIRVDTTDPFGNRIEFMHPTPSSGR